MGLDIYLRKCADLDAAIAAEKASEEEITALWEAVGGYSAATEEQKNEIIAKAEEVATKHGVNGRWGKHSSIQEFDEAASKIYPDHKFKIGYYRSSYNDGGIERVMRKIGLPGLHEIFEPGEEYNFKPNWDEALTRVNAAITGYEAHLAGPAGKFCVSEIRPLWGFGAADEKAALDLFMEQLDTHKDSKGGCDHYSKDQDGDGKEDWYLSALKIVRESIEYVIAQPDRQHFYLVWSC